MTIEEAEKACDVLVEKYIKVQISFPFEFDDGDGWMATDSEDKDMPDESALKCAILHYAEIVELWQNVKYEIGLSIYIENKLTEAKLILQTLKNRVK